MKATLYSLLMLSLLPIAVSGVAVIQTSDGSVEAEPNASPEQANEVKDSAVKEKIAWGKETDGLVANLRALTTTVKPGEPIEFEVRVKNVSKKDVHLYSGRAGEKTSPCTWSFRFMKKGIDQWRWAPPLLSLAAVPLKPGETTSARCVVTAEHKYVHFRNVNNKKESVRLPEGVYRVRAVSWFINARNQKVLVETNTIDVRIDDDTTEK